MEKSNDTLLTFPCDFTIKVFGTKSDSFEATVKDIIKKHVAQFSEDNIQKRPSENAKYIALSITIRAESKAQLDSIYQDLSSCPQVLMAL